MYAMFRIELQMRVSLVLSSSFSQLGNRVPGLKQMDMHKIGERLMGFDYYGMTQIIRNVRSPRAGVTVSNLCSFWEPNWSPLEEKEDLLAAEPPLQLLRLSLQIQSLSQAVNTSSLTLGIFPLICSTNLIKENVRDTLPINCLPMRLPCNKHLVDHPSV